VKGEGAKVFCEESERKGKVFREEGFVKRGFVKSL